MTPAGLETEIPAEMASGTGPVPEGDLVSRLVFFFFFHSRGNFNRRKCHWANGSGIGESPRTGVLGSKVERD